MQNDLKQDKKELKRLLNLHRKTSKQIITGSSKFSPLMVIPLIGSFFYQKSKANQP